MISLLGLIWIPHGPSENATCFKQNGQEHNKYALRLFKLGYQKGELKSYMHSFDIALNITKKQLFFSFNELYSS